MNRLFLILVLFVSSSCFSQSLRDSLFSGKLKADSALVAKSRINEQKAKEDSARRVQIDSLKKIGADTTQLTSAITTPAKTELKYSDNNKTWKKFDEYFVIIDLDMNNISSTRCYLMLRIFDLFNNIWFEKTILHSSNNISMSL